MLPKIGQQSIYKGVSVYNPRVVFVVIREKWKTVSVFTYFLNHNIEAEINWKLGHSEMW